MRFSHNPVDTLFQGQNKLTTSQGVTSWHYVLNAISRLNVLHNNNKANLRDLIAATDVVILLKLDSFFCPYDIEIIWANSNNNRTYSVKLCPFFQSYQ